MSSAPSRACGVDGATEPMSWRRPSTKLPSGTWQVAQDRPAMPAKGRLKTASPRLAAALAPSFKVPSRASSGAGRKSNSFI